ncbi:MAG: ribonuclease P protein component [Demequina sp.]
MRSAADFTLVRRSGLKSGRATVVVTVAVTGDALRMVGFAVSRAVGGAVVRNRVKRRLRPIMRDELATLPGGARVLVRALPAAADADYSQLHRDVAGALHSAHDKALT